MGWREGHGVGPRRLKKKPRFASISTTTTTSSSSSASTSSSSSSSRISSSAAARAVEAPRRKFGAFVVEELREVRDAIRGDAVDAEEMEAEADAQRRSDE